MAFSPHDLTAVTWRRSSYSNSSGGDCLEVAVGLPGLVPVRDSKRPDGPALIVHAAAWASFVASVTNEAPKPGR